MALEGLRVHCIVFQPMLMPPRDPFRSAVTLEIPRRSRTVSSIIRNAPVVTGKFLAPIATQIEFRRLRLHEWMRGPYVRCGARN